MMGQDVEYSTELNDDALIALAKKEGRVLLTRDLELYQRSAAKGIDAFYVEGANEAERLAELSERFSIALKIDMATSRCPRCNIKVKSLSKESIVGKVEKNTFAHYDEYWICSKCSNVYWQGAHWTKIRATLREAEEHLKKRIET
jgi:uncharacterized protein with PIN domain